VGDKVIVEFGKRLSDVMKDKGTVARLGGDEFVVLLPTIQLMDNPRSLAEEIKRVVQLPWEIDGNCPNVTTSIGIKIATTANETPRTLLKGADQALYAAKSAGGNTYKLATHSEKG